MKRLILASAGLGMMLATPASADPSPFDLAGPNLRVTVTRQGVTLPIARVPQLAAGDKVRVEALLPADETAHYLLVAASLRDPTNPPPDEWFAKSELWKPANKGGGPIELVVPANAQHLALFLAPETGGDFVTLRKAVKARPGAYVRAAQDLEQASLDRSRYEAYLAAIRRISATAPDTLAHVAPVVAASLHIRINEDCLLRQPDLQAACLTDARQTEVQGNGDINGRVSVSGAATDLALSLSATPAGGLGYYSPYVGLIREVIGIFGAMRSAKYQYIPALGVADGEKLVLALNTPPSFANPKSVLMAALPAVKPTNLPGIQPAADAGPLCLGAREPVLRLNTSPSFYATAYAHELKLRLRLPDGGALNLPLVPDAASGGVVIGQPETIPAGLAGPLSGSIRGQWGFDPLDGPRVTLETAGDWHWQQADADKQASAGDNGGPLRLTGPASACVAAVTLTPAAHGDSQGDPQPVAWKPSGPREIAVILPVPAIKPTGKPEPVTITITGPNGSSPAQVKVIPPAKAPAPEAGIVAHSSQPPGGQGTSAIALDGVDEIPADAVLNFTLKAIGDEHFTGHEAVEVGTAGSDITTRLTLGKGLTLVDATTMVATLTPAQALGVSAFGPLRARILREDAARDWLNLGTLVRLPRLKKLTCPADTSAPCVLSGEGLYLLASVSVTKDFENAASVPEGYPGFNLTVPRPKGGTLFVRLHDAPEVVNRLQAGALTSGGQSKQKREEENPGD